MFDVQAKTDLTVTHFAVHAQAATSATVEVWKKKTLGTCVGAQRDQNLWEFVGQETFVTSNPNGPSEMSRGSIPRIFVAAGTTQAFYVTYTGTTNLNRYSAGSGLGQVQASNGDMTIMEGYAKGYRFGDDYYPRAWNGQVYYERGGFAPLAAPTPRPVQTPPPTPKPFSIPTPMPTNRPNPAPTAKPVATPTRQPTDSNQVIEQLTTMFVGGNGQAGNMFEINVAQDIVVRAFDIHTYSTQNTQVLIFVKSGTYEGFEHNRAGWTEIANTWVTGAGSPNPTRISEEDVTPVSISAGQTYSFYVTLTESKIRYTNGAIAADDGIVKFTKSNGNKYPFGDSYKNRMWNGVLYYTSNSGPATPFPTPVPNSSYGPSNQIQTTLENRNGSYGSMFDIKAKTKLIIHNLMIHTYHQFGALVDVEVYKLKKKGTFIGSELDPSLWELLGSANIEGQGTGFLTPLPPGSLNEMIVEAGETQAIYVTIVGGGIRYSGGKSMAGSLAIFEENADIAVYEGAGVGAPRFGGTFTPRVFNGVVEYYTPNKAASDAAQPMVSRDRDRSSPANRNKRGSGKQGKKDEGWTCQEGDECKSGMCGAATGNGSRRLEARVNFCLDKNGEHEEDGDAELESSRI